jgi:hypothetical protein
MNKLEEHIGFLGQLKYFIQCDSDVYMSYFCSNAQNLQQPECTLI